MGTKAGGIDLVSGGDDAAIQRALEAIRGAEALVIGAGAGMGVDSGLPDFRGVHGFWRAYPPAERLGLRFEQLANPRWFHEDPALAWGFYGHRRNLYRATSPHRGFGILKRWLEAKPKGGFVFTSNIDAHFQKAGFDPDRIVECHGSLERLQCLEHCGLGVFEAGPKPLEIDEETLHIVRPMPRCPNCGALARPNVLMFGDWDWDPTVTEAQHQRFESWLRSLEGARLVVIECGAGTAVPTVRGLCERVARLLQGRLLRINLREPRVSARDIGLALGALEALEAIDRQFEIDGPGR